MADGKRGNGCKDKWIKGETGKKSPGVSESGSRESKKRTGSRLQAVGYRGKDRTGKGINGQRGIGITIAKAHEA
jgi:hypothetical protein